MWEGPGILCRGGVSGGALIVDSGGENSGGCEK